MQTSLPQDELKPEGESNPTRADHPIATSESWKKSGRPRFRFEKMNATRQLSPVDVFAAIQKMEAEDDQKSRCHLHATYGKLHPDCLTCSQMNREYLHQVRQFAIDYPNIYSWIFLDPKTFNHQYWLWPNPKEFLLLLLAICVQVFLPIVIAVQLFNELKEQHDIYGVSTLCPQNSSAQMASTGRAFAFVLSTLFGVVSTSSFLGKVRGNTMLLIFVPISGARCGVLMLGLAAQTLGLVAANVAEYLLFVNRGAEDFLLLMFTSLTMQSTLNADSVFLSEERNSELAALVGIILSDDVLQVGEVGNMMHKPVANTAHNFRKAYSVATLVMIVISIFLTVTVTICI